MLHNKSINLRQNSISEIVLVCLFIYHMAIHIIKAHKSTHLSQLMHSTLIWKSLTLEARLASSRLVLMEPLVDVLIRHLDVHIDQVWSPICVSERSLRKMLALMFVIRMEIK